MGVGMDLKVGRLKASSMSRLQTETPKRRRGWWGSGRGFPPPQQGSSWYYPRQFLEIYVQISAFGALIIDETYRTDKN